MSLIAASLEFLFTFTYVSNIFDFVCFYLEADLGHKTAHHEETCARSSFRLKESFPEQNRLNDPNDQPQVSERVSDLY
jgi:hypothetical protein